MIRTRAFLLATFVAFGAGDAHAETLVGLSTPLTGPYAWIGEPPTAGMQLAVADLNAAGGVLGEPLRLVIADDACDPEQAPLAARKLAGDGVAVVFGATCSGAALAAAPVLREAGIVRIEAAATNPRLTDEGEGVFRLVGRDDLQGDLAGDLLADHWVNKRIAIAHDGQAYGRGLAEQVKERLNRHGVREAVFVEYAPRETDYVALLEQLHAASIEVLYVGGYSPEIGLIIRYARERGLDFQLISGDGLSTGEFWAVAGPAGEGTLFTSFNDPSQDPRSAEVMARARLQEPSGRVLYCYAAVQVWAQAVAKAGTLDTKEVMRVLHEAEFDTVLGRIGFDEKGDVKGFEGSVALAGRRRAAGARRPGQAATPKTRWTKARCAGRSLAGTTRTCPLVSIAMASTPASVRRAVQKPWKPSMGRVRRLTRRWSCSTRLSSQRPRRCCTKRHISPSRFISRIAPG
jgi:branched-chain amino acid transport system substrate-binding protein